MRLNIEFEGELDLNGLTIPCYVLEDGTRVISGRGMQDALKMVDDDGEGSKKKPGTRIHRYLEQKTLSPYFKQGKSPGHFEPLAGWKDDENNSDQVN